MSFRTFPKTKEAGPARPGTLIRSRTSQLHPRKKAQSTPTCFRRDSLSVSVSVHLSAVATERKCEAGRRPSARKSHHHQVYTPTPSPSSHPNSNFPAFHCFRYWVLFVSRENKCTSSLQCGTLFGWR